MREWIITVTAAVAIITVTAIAVVLILNDRKKQEGSEEGWKVELWNIQQGYRIFLHFAKSTVLGRFSIVQNAVCDFPVREDATISREHILLYEHNGILWIWNLSDVNVTELNEQKLTTPHQLLMGARLKMGNSIFLVTGIEKNA